MIHILFGQSPAGTLKYVLKKLGRANKEQVITFWEMFSVGPIYNFQNRKGRKYRITWMKNIMNEEFHEHLKYKKLLNKTISQIKTIPNNEPILIWISENAHEQLGLRYVLNLLKGKTNKIKIINASKLASKLYIKSQRQYTLRTTGELSPDELEAIYETTQTLNTLSQIDRENLEEQWSVLAENNDLLRIWINDQIASVSENYYDSIIISTAKKLHDKQIAKDFIKAPSLVGEVLGDIEDYVSDGFLDYRLKRLIENEIFEVRGSQKTLRSYSIMLK